MSSAVNTSFSKEKNSGIIKKTKHFFGKKKSKHSENQSLENSTSFINMKEDSNKTLFPTNSENVIILNVGIINKLLVY